jgi:hypothetical protein
MHVVCLVTLILKLLALPSRASEVGYTLPSPAPLGVGNPHNAAVQVLLCTVVKT